MKHLWARIIKPLVIWLVQGILGVAVLALILFMVIEWASGCGETYTDSKGVTHINECTWKSEVPIKK